MTVRIEAIEFIPKPGGWTSGRREFGTFQTFVTGENGAGKTPVMKGIAYALGHTLKLTDEVKANCASIRLTLRVDGRKVQIERSTDDEERRFVAHTTDRENQVFESDADFTKWLLSLLGIPFRPLAGKERGTIVGKPYASVLVPVFWLDQDRGWHVPYSPLRSKDFVKSQGEEAVRWLLGVAQRHPAVDKKDQLKLESQIESDESLIRARMATISELRSELTDDGLEALVESKRRIVEQLRTTQGSLQSATSSGRVLDDRVEAVTQTLEAIHRRRAAMAGERQKLASAVEEIEADQEVLLANENASDLFRQVCDNVNCGFFRRPAESFGRRLLFVKDQIKDLRLAMSSVDTETVHLEASIADLGHSLQLLTEQRKSAQAAAGTDQLVAAVDALAAELQRVTLQLVRREQLVEEEKRLARLVERRALRRAELEEMTGTRRTTDDRTREVRDAFEKSVFRWLKIINTPNLEQVGVNENFEITVRTRRFNYDSSQSGSTRTRFVLAYHAALLEVSLTRGGHHPPWLICDAPRQQELNADDLVSWVEALRALAKEHPFQLVLSGKDIFTRIDEKTDKLWSPTFVMNETFPQHLGPAKSG